jgi:SAM-dependent MidA family methyltransferase
MTDQPFNWPEPDALAREVSTRLAALVRARIERAGGWIPFSEYMHTVLYEPGLGYYMAGSRKLGADGDFVTAPELGDFLAQAIVTTALGHLAHEPDARVLEVGAGTGALARATLARLDASGCSHVEYVIFEPSPELRDRQQRTLRHFGARVSWIDDLAEARINGIVVANEVADALPVERFVIDAGRMLPRGVGLDAGRFVWRTGPRTAAWTQACAQLESGLAATLPDGYESEWCPALGPWTSELAGALRHGAAFVIDYGLPQREYYHPERSHGTLICHYRHRAHADPFLHPGLQDITAWVDFTALADAAERAGLTVLGYATQGHWLVESLSAEGVDLASLTPARLADLKTLVLPGEMGERFKVLLLGRGVDAMSLAGRDLRNRL